MRKPLAVLLPMVLLLFTLNNVSLLSADKPGSLSISDVDSTGYPEVKARVTLANVQGFAMGQLDAAALNISAGGQPVDAGTVRLQPDASAPVALALLIDLSMPAADFANQIKAATNLVDSARADDRIAIISFGDSVTVDQAPTGDRALLRAALAGLKPGGSITQLYLAVEAAQKQLEGTSAPAGRRAVLAFTDTGDTSPTKSSRATEAIVKTKVPIRGIGFGTRAKNGFAELEATNLALVDNVSTSADLAEAAAKFVDGLRQSFVLRFRAATRVDDASHALRVALKVDDKVAGESTFTAKRGIMSIGLEGANEGRIVTGDLALTAQASGPAAIDTVEFAVDGTRVGLANQAPFTGRWSTQGVAPGNHVITVRATDKVGNVQVLTRTVQVPAAGSVQTSARETRLVQGVPLTVQLAYSSPLPIKKLELILDDGPALQLREFPAQYVQETASLTPGPHKMVVRVTDELDRVTESTQLFDVSPRPLINWQTVLGVLASLGVLGLALWLIAWLNARWRNAMARRLALELRNEGNTATRFMVRVAPAGANAVLNLMLNGEALVQQARGELRSEAARIAMPVETRALPRPGAAPAMAGVAAANGAGAAAAPDKIKTTFGKPDAKKLGAAREKADEAVGVGASLGGALADVMSLIGGILPGSAGRSLSAAGSGIRQTTYAAKRLQDTGARVTAAGAQVKEIAGRANEAKQQAGAAASQAKGMAAQASAAMQSNGSAATGHAGHEETAAAATAAASLPTSVDDAELWGVTPPVQPGHALELMLHAHTTQPMRGGRYNVSLHSCPVDGLAYGVKPAVEQFVLPLGARTLLARVQPLLQTVIVLGLAAWAIWSLLRMGGVIPQ